jgi:hypothetical protein
MLKQKPRGIVLAPNGIAKVHKVKANTFDERGDKSSTYATEHAALYRVDRTIPRGASISVHLQGNPEPLRAKHATITCQACGKDGHRVSLEPIGYDAAFLNKLIGPWVPAMINKARNASKFDLQRSLPWIFALAALPIGWAVLKALNLA